MEGLLPEMPLLSEVSVAGIQDPNSGAFAHTLLLPSLLSTLPLTSSQQPLLISLAGGKILLLSILIVPYASPRWLSLAMSWVTWLTSDSFPSLKVCKGRNHNWVFPGLIRCLAYSGCLIKIC